MSDQPPKYEDIFSEGGQTNQGFRGGEGQGEGHRLHEEGVH